jgi:ABC-type uncharacterized transport system auxiliary subunit
MNRYKKAIGLLILFALCSLFTQAQYIGSAEYFWDTDPGEGNGIVLAAADGNLDSVIEAVVLSTSSLPSSGLHTFNVRVRDDNNVWGPVFRTMIEVLPALSTTRSINVTLGEYFWDTDPGQGNASVMVAFDGAFDSAVETAYQNSIAVPGSLGVHSFHVRVRDAENNWGPVFSAIINVDPNILTQREIKVTTGEYFWDTDPGQGSGNAMVAFDGAFDSAVETAYQSNISVPGSLGVHTFNLRVRDAENNWGPVFRVIINIDPNILTQREIKVTAGEYFWDADPGQGSANPMVAFDGAFDDAIETAYQSNIAVPGLMGVHTFNARVRDAENNWGPVFTVIINVDPSILTQREIKVTAGEYFFDTDPGDGNATAMVAFDGAFDTALETIIGGGIPPVTIGMHVLYMRARDAESNWGPKFGIVVNVDTTIVTEVPEVHNSIPRVAVYPNPFRDAITIEINSDGNMTSDIRITDITGRVVTEVKSVVGKTTIAGSYFAPGIYFATIVNGKETVVKRIIRE